MVNVMQELERIIEESEIGELLERIYFFNSKRDSEFELNVLIEAAIDDEVRSSIEDPYDWIRGRSVYVEEAIDKIWEQGETMIEEAVTEAQYRWWRNLAHENTHEVVLVVGLRGLKFVVDSIPSELLDIYTDEAFNTPTYTSAECVEKRFLGLREEYLEGPQKIIVGERVEELRASFPRELMDGIDHLLTIDINLKMYAVFETVVEDIVYGNDDEAREWMCQNWGVVEKYINNRQWEGSMLATSMEARRILLINIVQGNLLLLIEYMLLKILDSNGYDHVIVNTYNEFLEPLKKDKMRLSDFIYVSNLQSFIDSVLGYF